MLSALYETLSFHFSLFINIKIKGKFEQVSAGHGNNVWAVDEFNSIYRKKDVNSMQPYGTDWKRVYGMNVVHITAGLTGVFGITKKDGYLVLHKGKFVWI